MIKARANNYLWRRKIDNKLKFKEKEKKKKQFFLFIIKFQNGKVFQFLYFKVLLLMKHLNVTNTKNKNLEEQLLMSELRVSPVKCTVKWSFSFKIVCMYKSKIYKIQKYIHISIYKQHVEKNNIVNHVS